MATTPSPTSERPSESAAQRALIAPASSPGLPDWAAEVAAAPRRIPAWMLSAAFHAAMLLVLGLLIQPSVPASVGQPQRRTGIALVAHARQQTFYLDESDMDSSTASDASPEPLSSPLPQLEQLPFQPAVPLPGAPQGAIDVARNVSGAEGLTKGSGPSRQLTGGRASTQLFGVEADGSKFVYVFDRSESMLGFRGRPMAAARGALLQSLQDLSSVHQFQVVFYNERPTILNPFHPQPPRILFATDENKRLAVRFIEAIKPSGGTRHMEALELGLRMQPDVLFFLTDAADPKLTPDELQRIRRRNDGRTAIHTVEFGSGPSQSTNNFLVRLARQNGGRHTYVDVTRL